MFTPSFKHLSTRKYSWLPGWNVPSLEVAVEVGSGGVGRVVSRRMEIGLEGESGSRQMSERGNIEQEWEGG